MSDIVTVPLATRLASLAARVGDTPELALDLEVLEGNIARIARAAAAAGVTVRPHIKTHKLPQVARMQIEAGSVGIQVAKVGEAEVMVDAGIEDVLVGYPIVGTAKVARLIALAQRARVAVSLDSYEVAAPIAAAASADGVSLAVLVELDTGLSRIGVAPGLEAITLAQRLHELDGVEVVGVLTHEGHAYAAARSRDHLAAVARAACERAVETAQDIRDRGIAAPTVSVGSSGTFEAAITVPGVTEVRPGTYVFNDRTQVALGAAAPKDLAVAVIATVVSRRAGEVVVDAGSKALTSDRMIVREPPPTFGDAYTPRGDRGEVVRLSEEHGVIAFDPASAPQVGERVAIVPNHICPVVNLFERIAVFAPAGPVDPWPIAARGRLQ